MYGDNKDRIHGILTEDDAYIIFEKICKFFSIEVEHCSEINKFDIDVKITFNNGKELYIDIKSPGENQRSSPNLAISYAKNNNLSGRIHAYIDGNILKEKNINKKCIALASQHHTYEDPCGRYYCLEKKYTLTKFFKLIKKINV